MYNKLLMHYFHTLLVLFNLGCGGDDQTSLCEILDAGVEIGSE